MSEDTKGILGLIAYVVLIAAMLIVPAYYENFNTDRYIAAGGHGRVTNKTYYGPGSFRVIVQYDAPGSMMPLQRDYTVREQTFDAVHVGDQVVADQLN